MTTSKNAAKELPIEETHESAEDVSVPKQAAKVTSIKKNEEPAFYDEDDIVKPSIKDKARTFVKHNKKYIGGAAAAALLAVGVLVVRKRNTVDEQDTETPEA